jgi:TetR/AcrR family transcriptional regulator, cholesterol catabolism regulator
MTKASSIGRRRSAARTDSSESYKQRRAEIVAAAVRVFNRVGLEGASIAAVAAEANIDRASIYYYISSKEELFDELVQTVVERNLDIVQRIHASAMSAKGKLRELISALMISYGEHYPLFYIYIRENLSHVTGERMKWARYMRKLNREHVDLIIAIIEQGYADGSLRRVGPARVIAYGLLGILGWTHRWFRPQESDVSAGEIGKTYAELLLGGLESHY